MKAPDLFVRALENAGDTIAPLVREAFRLAIEETPGAAHLERPVDYSLNHKILNVLLKNKACSF